MSERTCRWGILSTAGIARKNWQAIRNSGNGTVVAVASRSVEKAQAFIDECMATVPFPEAPAAVASYEALLQRDDVAVKARCTFINSNDSAAGRKLELWSETTSAGTLVYNDNDSGYFGDTDNQTSEWVSQITENDTSWRWSNYIDQGVLVTPGGTVVMMDGETFGYGLNAQGSDCLLVGQIHSFSGSAAPEDFDPTIEAPVLSK